MGEVWRCPWHTHGEIRHPLLGWVMATVQRCLVTACARPVRQHQRAAANEAVPAGLSPGAHRILCLREWHHGKI